jgi:hypothetical protein
MSNVPVSPALEAVEDFPEFSLLFFRQGSELE